MFSVLEGRNCFCGGHRSRCPRKNAHISSRKQTRMTLSVLPLETSRLIYELVGEYECERYWVVYRSAVSSSPRLIWAKPRNGRQSDSKNYLVRIPAPNFAETIRVLPRLCKVKRKEEEKVKGWISNAWLEHHIANDALDLYMNAPSEPKGMAAVNSYLLKLLK